MRNTIARIGAVAALTAAALTGATVAAQPAQAANRYTCHINVTVTAHHTHVWTTGTPYAPGLNYAYRIVHGAWKTYSHQYSPEPRSAWLPRYNSIVIVYGGDAGHNCEPWQSVWP
jgi:uncharacterized protein YfaQ (DUF2300 family)